MKKKKEIFSLSLKILILMLFCNRFIQFYYIFLENFAFN